MSNANDDESVGDFERRLEGKISESEHRLRHWMTQYRRQAQEALARKESSPQDEPPPDE